MDEILDKVRDSLTDVPALLNIMNNNDVLAPTAFESESGQMSLSEYNLTNTTAEDRIADWNSYDVREEEYMDGGEDLDAEGDLEMEDD
jgi:hypothetical protein